MKKTLKIGIDYHGVINKNPSFFKTFNQLILSKGHEIIVVSGGRSEDVKKYLKEHQIPYTSVWSLVDYFVSKRLITFYEDGSFFVPNEIWNRAKAKYCMEKKIDVHIDDSSVYGSYFQTPFCLYAPIEQKCTFIKKNISTDFNQPAEKVWQDLFNALQKVTSIQNR